MNDRTSQASSAERLARMDDNITIRPSSDADAAALGRLAQLDGTLYDGGEALVAEAEHELVAAIPLDGARVFADPFRHTAQVVAMLELRRLQLDLGGERSGSPLALRRARRRAVRKPRRYRGPASA